MPSDEEILLNNLGGPSTTTRVLTSGIGAGSSQSGDVPLKNAHGEGGRSKVVRGRGDYERGDYEDGGRGIEETDSALEPPGRSTATQYLDFSPMRPPLNSGL